MVGRLISLATRVVPRHLLHRVAIVVGWCLAQALRGRRYIDPIDGFGYRRMLPYGRLQRRANALAPRSLSLERHRLLWLYLTREVQIDTRQLRVLHMAPEWALRQRLKDLAGITYTTADLNSPWADVHCDIQALPFADGSYDLVLCNHVLEHIPDDRKAMREIFRVLAPGGMAMLLVPQDASRVATLEDPAINTPALREQHYGQSDHLRLYGLDYAERLSQTGFAVEILDYAGTLGEACCARYAIRTGEFLHIGHKPVNERITSASI